MYRLCKMGKKGSKKYGIRPYVTFSEAKTKQAELAKLGIKLKIEETTF